MTDTLTKTDRRCAAFNKRNKKQNDRLRDKESNFTNKTVINNFEIDRSTGKRQLRRQKERKREREKEERTEKQRDVQNGKRYRDRTKTHRNTEAERHLDRKAYRQIHIEPDRQTETKTKETERNKDTKT